MWEIFEKLIKDKGLRVSDVARATGISNATFSAWKRGEYTPKQDKLRVVADYLGVSLNYLLTGEESEQDAKIRNLKALGNYLDNMNQSYEESEGVLRNLIEEYQRLHGVFDVAAGNGRINDYPLEFISEGISDTQELIKICGDSMFPDLHDGDICVVEKSPETAKTDYTVVKVDGESATVKFVEVADNGVWLRAVNKEVYEDKFFTIQEVMTLPVTIIGKVVEIRRKL